MKQATLFDDTDYQVLVDLLTGDPQRVEALAEAASLTLPRAAELLALATLRGDAYETRLWAFVRGGRD